MDNAEIWHAYAVDGMRASDVATKFGITVLACKKRLAKYRKAHGLPLPKRVASHSPVCRKGHPRTAKNSRVDKQGRRHCLDCDNAWYAAHGRVPGGLRIGGNGTRRIVHCGNCGEVGHHIDNCPSRAVARCRCGLVLPCYSCLPTARELAEARQPSGLAEVMR